MSFKISRTAPPFVSCEPGAAEPVRFAAEELSKYLGRILEVEVPRQPAAVPIIQLIEKEDPYLGEEGFLISEKDGEMRIQYVSTMDQGKSLFPDMLEEYIGDSPGMEVPMRVVRTALFVERDGAHHSPISKGVVQNLL